MEWPLFLTLFLCCMVVLLLLRVPVAIALLAIGVGGAVLLYGFGPGVQLSILGITSGLASFNLVPVPMFILMGDLLFRSGIAQRALNGVSALLGRVPARDAVLATGSGALLGILSGSPMGTTAILGGTLVPQMVRNGYNHRLAMGSVLGAGGLAMIIPPSTLIIIWGATANVPVGPLLIAGLLPGLLMALNYAVVSMTWGRVFGGAPRSQNVERLSTGRRLRAFAGNVLPLGVVVFAVLGLILLGVATPSESAALGVGAAILLTVVYRSFSLRTLWTCCIETAAVTGMVFLIVSAATIFSQVLAGSGATRGLIGALTGTVENATVAVVMMLAITFLLGTFLEQIAIILLTVPFFMPIVDAFAVDPIWFGIIFMISLQVGLTSPPFGMTLFVMRNYQPPGTKTVDVWISAMPYIASDVVTVAILMAFPIIVTVLPAVALA